MIMRAMTGLEVSEHYKGAGKGSQHYKWGLKEERNFPSKPSEEQDLKGKLKKQLTWTG